MTHSCDECESRMRLAELELRVEKVLDLCQAAELLNTRREHQRGFREALREAAKLLKEQK
jgi:hypothetical protein